MARGSTEMVVDALAVGRAERPGVPGGMGNEGSPMGRALDGELTFTTFEADNPSFQ